MADSDEIIYDHIDGEIVGPMPFDNPEKLVALLQERMTSEELWTLCEHLLTRHPELIPLAERVR